MAPFALVHSDPDKGTWAASGIEMSCGREDTSSLSSGKTCRLEKVAFPSSRKLWLPTLSSGISGFPAQEAERHSQVSTGDVCEALEKQQVTT